MRPPLNNATFHILLSLAVGERHGYGIMKQSKINSQGAVTLGPGSLYSTIKKLLSDSYIEETSQRPDPALDDSRRRYYRLTAKGQAALGAELGRMDEMAALGRRYGISHQIVAE